MRGPVGLRDAEAPVEHQRGDRQIEQAVLQIGAARPLVVQQVDPLLRAREKWIHLLEEYDLLVVEEGLVHGTVDEDPAVTPRLVPESEPEVVVPALRPHELLNERGFEVIGITLENPGLRPKDTPEQVAAKLARAKEKLLEFAAKHEMPWPQHFDGKHFKNDFATKFGINAIPAMFLLNKEGKVVTADARGDRLEMEVKRVLGL